MLHSLLSVVHMQTIAHDIYLVLTFLMFDVYINRTGELKRQTFVGIDFLASFSKLSLLPRVCIQLDFYVPRKSRRVRERQEQLMDWHTRWKPDCIWNLSLIQLLFTRQIVLNLHSLSKRLSFGPWRGTSIGGWQELLLSIELRRHCNKRICQMTRIQKNIRGWQDDFPSYTALLCFVASCKIRCWT